MKNLDEYIKKRNFKTISIREAMKQHNELMKEIRKMPKQKKEGGKPNSA